MYDEESYGQWRRRARTEVRISLEWVADEMGIGQQIG